MRPSSGDGCHICSAGDVYLPGVKAAWGGQNRPKKGAWARVGLLGCGSRALGCWRDPSPDRLCVFRRKQLRKDPSTQHRLSPAQLGYCGPASPAGH